NLSPRLAICSRARGRRGPFAGRARRGRDRSGGGSIATRAPVEIIPLRLDFPGSGCVLADDDLAADLQASPLFAPSALPARVERSGRLPVHVRQVADAAFGGDRADVSWKRDNQPPVRAGELNRFAADGRLIAASRHS